MCEFRVEVEKRRGHLCVRWRARSHQSLSSLVRNRRQVFTFPREWCTPRIGIYVGRRTFPVDAFAPLFHAAFDLSRLDLSIVVWTERVLFPLPSVRARLRRNFVNVWRTKSLERQWVMSDKERTNLEHSFRRLKINIIINIKKNKFIFLLTFK